jgi:2-oxoglutarate dehydrogenase E1 component
MESRLNMPAPSSPRPTDPLPDWLELSADNLHYLENLRAHFLQEPALQSSAWAKIFQEPVTPHASSLHTLELERLQVRVLQYINAYRFLGHFAARLDPLGRQSLPPPSELTRAYHHLEQVPGDLTFDPGSLHAPSPARLETIEEILRDTYCACIGAEFMHLTSTPEKRWIQQRLESVRGHFGFDPATRRAILERLTAAEGLERYLHTRYVGQKRFSLEGAESLIPLLTALVQRGGARGLEEIVVGMAHRGRLNVQVNLFGKSLEELASEFEGRHSPIRGTGDVKYHLGLSADIQTTGGPVHLALAFNPSHLEIVAPVVVGSVRARQVRVGDRKGMNILPVVIHGDAAFAGQGVVMETFNMSQTRGFSTKGTVHVVVNNQIGFTISTMKDARSTHYATDVAKMVSAPIFHVNADDPEAVVFVTQMAMDYRMRFAKDVVIDLVCYRRQGHNEADEPAATQPMMYRIIRSLPTTREQYAARLVAEGFLSAADAERMQTDYRQRLESGESVVPGLLTAADTEPFRRTDWTRFSGQGWDQPVHTGVAQASLRELLERLDQIPDGFVLHPRVRRIMDARQAMAKGLQDLDWGTAETLAYATLLQEGYRVRLSGQDSGRGTFFHRHAVLHDQETGQSYVPLRQLEPDSPRFLVTDSLLSEEAVLAFEYGYATTAPDALVLWEAQFGDFANGAQVVIDQFISSGEQKWNRLCGLVLLLPHGYEGQGPEHSSARPERFLQLCAEENMQVCVPTTPAQIFHLLRRQLLRTYRKPLVVMTPKSLLRHRLAVSALSELELGSFQTVIDEIDSLPPATIQRVLLTAGRLYYDLLEERRAQQHQSVAILRLEQCYPFPEEALRQALLRYPQAREVVWVQDEPENQGYLNFVQPRLQVLLTVPGHLLYTVARPPTAAPAVGYPEVHKSQLQDLLRRSFGPFKDRPVELRPTH